MKNSYICISSSNPWRELELYNKCLSFHDKGLIKFSSNNEILIPWTNWDKCHFELFFDSNKDYFYVDEDISIGEYILETEEIIETFDNNLLNRLSLLESKEPRFPLFSIFGNLVSSYRDHRIFRILSFLIQDINYKFNIFTISTDLNFSNTNYTQIEDYKVSDNDELEDILLRRFINSNLKRFESLNNVINKK